MGCITRLGNAPRRDGKGRFHAAELGELTLHVKSFDAEGQLLREAALTLDG